MTDIFVSDLFGYNINNDSPFVIINSKELYKLLKKVTEDEYHVIWEYNRNKIDPILKARNVDPKRFLSSGNMVYNKIHKYNKNPHNDFTTIVLVNKSISKAPNSFDDTEIASLSDGKIIRPVYTLKGEEKYFSLGAYYVKNGSELDKQNIAVIPESMLLKMKPRKSLMASDEYSLISSGWTIDKSKLFSGDMRDMKLTSTSGKYLTLLEGEGSSTGKKLVKLKSKQSSERQTLSYNAQGELISDGKCLTYSDQNSPVYFDSCEPNNKQQKWNMTNGKISPHTGHDKCLTVGNSDSVYLKECQDLDEQSWNSEESDISTSSDYGWDKYKGKTVVLVASDNPWYINEDTTYPMKFSNKENIRDDVKYRENADYQSSIILDPLRPDLGLGHSILERANNGCAIEGFGEENENKYTVIILFIIIFLIVVYKWAR